LLDFFDRFFDLLFLIRLRIRVVFAAQGYGTREISMGKLPVRTFPAPEIRSNPASFGSLTSSRTFLGTGESAGCG
jgi:hypothetical protein